jgi:hypothetical protein
MTPDFDSSVEKISSIVGLLNDIQQIIAQKEIKDSISLCADRHSLAALCTHVLRTYEVAMTCRLIRSVPSISTCRANMAHHSESLSKDDGAIGFDQTTPQELWDMHFSSSGCLTRVRFNVRTAIEKNSGIDLIIKEKLQQKGLPPNILLDSSDFSHLPVIEEINEAIRNGITCLVGSLFLLSDRHFRPSIDQSSGFLQRSLGLRVEQVNFIISELVEKNILARSEGNKYLLV